MNVPLPRVGWFLVMHSGWFCKKWGYKEFFFCNLRYFIKIFLSHFANLEIFNKSGTMCTPEDFCFNWGKDRGHGSKVRIWSKMKSQKSIFSLTKGAFTTYGQFPPTNGRKFRFFYLKTENLRMMRSIISYF